MRDQLKRLEVLQNFDAQIQELSNSIKAIPAKLEASQGDLQRVETLLNNERTQLVEAKRYYDSQKSQMEYEEGQVTSAKSKMGQARNTREYGAAQREIDQTRENLATREGEITKLVEAIQNKEKVLGERESSVAELREGLSKDEDAARAKIKEIQAQIDGMKNERERIAAQVKPDFLKRYGSIRMKRGLALAPVVNGSCRGCNMNIPPQLYNTLQRGISLEVCPYCHRIIYWDELMKDPEEVAAAAKAAAEKLAAENLAAEKAPPGKAGKRKSASEKTV